MEIPTAELEKYHNDLIRNSPEYRLFLMLEDLRAEMTPPLGTEEYEPSSPSQFLPELGWSREQWDIVTQLSNEVISWQQKHAETLLAKDKFTRQVTKLLKKKSKYD